MLHYFVIESQKAPASSTDKQRHTHLKKKENKKMEIKKEFGFSVK
jgi:hypothetical protein